jgi:DNA-binding transcriptional ArsR family regulator
LGLAAPAEALSPAVNDALGHPTRRAILAELAHAPRSAGQVAALFAIGQPAVSRHLRVLRDSGLVEQIESQIGCGVGYARGWEELLDHYLRGVRGPPRHCFLIAGARR